MKDRAMSGLWERWGYIYPVMGEGEPEKSVISDLSRVVRGDAKMFPAPCGCYLIPGEWVVMKCGHGLMWQNNGDEAIQVNEIHISVGDSDGIHPHHGG